MISLKLAWVFLMSGYQLTIVTKLAVTIILECRRIMPEKKPGKFLSITLPRQIRQISPWSVAQSRQTIILSMLC